MNYHAYWISPDGVIIPVIGGHHIAQVLSNPDQFGFKREELESCYEKYGEPYGLEGKAREEIIRLLFKNNWIRLRYYPENDLWKVEISGFTDRQKEYIRDWCLRMMKGEYGDKVSGFTEIKVIDEKSGMVFYGNFFDIGKLKSQTSQPVKE
jgi:hypothetical protein